MFIFTFTLSFALFALYVVMPISKARRVKAGREWEENLKWVKLRAIRRYYPALRNLPEEVIMRKYDLDSWYNSIGR